MKDVTDMLRSYHNNLFLRMFIASAFKLTHFVIVIVLSSKVMSCSNWEVTLFSYC